MKKLLRSLCVAFFAIAGCAAYGATYTFPSGTLPAGCSSSGTTVTCSSLTLGFQDVVNVTGASPVTVNVNGTFDSGNQASVNVSGAAANLNFVVSGAATINDRSRLNANLTAASVNSSGTLATLGGNVTATSGGVTIGFQVTVAGSITTNAGAILISNQALVSGSVTSGSGSIQLNFKAVVSGGLQTSGAITLDNEAEVNGAIVGGAGAVTTNFKAKVAGAISTTTGGIAIGQQVQASSCVRSTASGPITLGFQANVNSVCCGTTCGTACVTKDSSIAMPPLCTALQTCIVDSFATGTLDPSLWNPLALGGSFVPQVVDVSGQKRLRLTTANGSLATLVQLKKWFPAAGNKIVVTFDHYVYGGNGADGVVIVFSDASVTPAPGASGGSLGFAQKTGVNGFAGGWLGVGIDEFGNFPNPSEGRVGYPAGWVAPVGANGVAEFRANNVSVRGSGSGTTGYRLLANTGTLATPIWAGTNTSATLQKYRITIDNSNNTNAYVTVQRDTSGTGSSYTAVIPTFDVLGANSGQSTVPANLLVSLGSGTGGQNNIHELANLSICATYINDPGGSNVANNFECVETGVNTPWVAAARKPLYTKLVGTAFKFDVAALKADGTLESNYVAAGGNSKYARVELFDDATPAASCSAYSSPVASQTVTFASGVFSGTAGRVLTSNFNIATPYRKLRCRVKECTDSTCASFTAVTPGCSSDQFAVRPAAAALVTSATAVGPTATAIPAIKVGDNFTLRATTNASGSYSGTWTLDATKLTAQEPTSASKLSGGAVGTLTPSSLVANAPAVSATYDEVGYLYLAAGAFIDSSFAATDRATGDCITSTTSGNNVSDTLSGGKYGCDIGNRVEVSLGRFYPHRFKVSNQALTAACSAVSPFTYFGQDGFSTAFTVTAENASNGTTANYRGLFAKLNLANYAAYGFSSGISATPTLLPLPAGSALSSSSTAPTGTWGTGTANIVARHRMSRPTALTGATLITVTAAPTDGEVPASTGTAVAANASFRYGRLRLQNAYGSEKLALSVPVQAQFYDSTAGAFRLNTDDSCTALAMPSKRSLLGAALPDGAANVYYYPTVAGGNQITSTSTTGTVAAALSAGAASINFSAPGTNGWVDLILATPDHLKYNWGNCSGQTGTAGLLDDLPCARATFGIYKSPLIYRRENY